MAGDACVQIQKVIPGTLEALAQAISEHPTVSVFRDNKMLTLDTSHVMFLLISDIGWQVRSRTWG